jgi:hypothetical protein
MFSGMIVGWISHAHIVKVNVWTLGTPVPDPSNELGFLCTLRTFAADTVVSDQRWLGTPGVDINTIATAWEFS